MTLRPTARAHGRRARLFSLNPKCTTTAPTTGPTAAMAPWIPRGTTGGSRSDCAIHNTDVEPPHRPHAARARGSDAATRRRAAAEEAAARRRHRRGTVG